MYRIVAINLRAMEYDKHLCNFHECLREFPYFEYHHHHHHHQSGSINLSYCITYFVCLCGCTIMFVTGFSRFIYNVDLREAELLSPFLLCCVCVQMILYTLSRRSYFLVSTLHSLTSLCGLRCKHGTHAMRLRHMYIRWSVCLRLFKLLKLTFI